MKEKKKKRYSNLSDEKKEELKEKRRMKYRAAKSASQSNIIQERSKSKNPSQRNEKDRERKRVERNNQTLDDKLKSNEKAKERMRAKRNDQTLDDKLKINEKDKERMRTRRNYLSERSSGSNSQRQQRNQTSNNTILSKSVKIEGPMKDAFEALNRTKLDGDENHSGLVCIICDRLIIGTQKLLWVKKDALLKHENRLSVEKYEENMGYKLPSTLRDQYLLDDTTFCNMLLSIRARINEEDDSYSCCEQCHRSLQRHRTRSPPPKYSIANGFAIGHIPESLENVSDLVSLMIAPVRPFAYVIAFNGGSHKRLKGNVMFFDNNISQIQSVMEHFFKLDKKSKYILSSLWKNDAKTKGNFQVKM